jgi:hypothetical protein
MLVIKRNNFSIIVKQLKRKFYELQRISKTQVLTIYARRKEIDGKIMLLSQPIAEVKKVYNF